MTLYTPMPLELVLDGFGNNPGPILEVTVGALTMQVAPFTPGVGRIIRLLSAPLSCYLRPEYEPGQLIYYGAAFESLASGASKE
jgi:hypothetical protein